MIGLSAIGRIGLQSLRSAARGVRWDELFSGFPGVAYDKTRVESLTQDRGGLTPVTAAAQSIGLAHDYARAASGWVGGADLLAGIGGFSSATGWSAPVAGSAISGGTLNFDGATSIGGGVAVVFASPAVSVIANRSYLVTYEIIGGTTNPVSVGLTVGGVLGTARTAAGVYSEILTAVSNASVQVLTRTNAGIRTGSIDNISVREITGNPLIAPTDARRPTWGAMANGLPCSEWDGTRAMATAAPVDFSSTDQVTVMAAVRCTTDAGVGVIAELSASWSVSNGTFLITRDSTIYRAASRGTQSVGPLTPPGISQPDNAILVMRGRISTDYLELIRNGTQLATSASDQGTGNYGNHILNIGARNAASPSLLFNGNIARIAAIGGNIGAEREAAMLGLLAAGFAPS